MISDDEIEKRFSKFIPKNNYAKTISIDLERFLFKLRDKKELSYIHTDKRSILVRLNSKKNEINLEVYNERIELKINLILIICYFDDSNLELIKLLIESALLGNYTITYKVNTKDKVTHTNIMWDDNKLSFFNRDEKLVIFNFYRMQKIESNGGVNFLKK